MSWYGALSKQLCKHRSRVSFSSSPKEQNNREAKLDITFKEVDKFSRQAETRADQLGARQSTVALACATDLSEQKSEFNFI